jgi:hypothetical protein
MKKILIVGLGIVMSILHTNIASAQSDSLQIPYTFTTHFDSISKGLIATRIPYQTLYDRVYPWSGLIDLANKDSISVDKFYQAWWDLEKCKIGATVTDNK